MSYRKNVAINANAKEERQYINFSIFKKNERGVFQQRTLQIDLTNGLLKNFNQETAQRVFEFSTVQSVIASDDNPLQFFIQYASWEPYECYARSPRERTTFVSIMQHVIESRGSDKLTKVKLARNIVKAGGFDYKNRTFGWDRRFLYLYPLSLHIHSTSDADVPRHHISLFSTPLSKEGDKVINIHQPDNMFTFRFDTVAERDDWFEALIQASHNEGEEWDDLSEDVKYSQRHVDIQKDAAETAERVQAVTLQLQEMEREKAALEREIRDRKAQRAAVSQDVEKLTSDKRAEATRKEELTQRKVESPAVLSRVEERLRTAEEALAKAEVEFKAAKDARLSVQYNKESAELEMERETQKSQGLEREMARLEEEIEKVRSSLQQAIADKARMQREIADEQDAIKKVEQSKGDAEKELSQVDEKLNEARTRKQQAEALASEAEETYKIVLEEKQSVDAEIAGLQSESERLSQELEKIARESNQIKEETLKLSKERDAAEEQLQQLRK